MKKHLLSRGLLLFSLLVLLSSLASAQVKSTGAVLGTVKDPSGAVIPGATISLTNVDAGSTIATESNASGDYIFPVVPVGRYELSVTKSGFKKVLLSDISVSALENVRLDPVLSIGQLNEQVTVKAAPLAVNTVSASTGDTVTGVQLHSLPLSSRLFTQLIFLEPGVVSSNPSGGGGFGSMSVASFNLNGVRSDENNLQIDGVRNLDTFGGNAFNSPNLNAIAEFRIENNSYDAATGRVGGGQINLISRSGTNAWHGNVFEYFRNDKLNARNFFAPDRPKTRYNNFGYDVGGPVLKDRFFFFWSEEWRRIIQSTGTRVARVASPAERTGDFSALLPAGTVIRDPGTGQPFPNNIIPQDRIDPNAQLLLNNYFPLPTPGFQQGDFNFTASDPDTTRWREESIRLDFKANDKFNMFARYTQDNATLQNPFALFNPNVLPKVGASVQFFPIYNWAYQLTWTPKPNFVSEFKWGLYFGTDKKLEQTRDSCRCLVPQLNIPEVFPGPHNEQDRIPSLFFGGNYAGITLLWPFHNKAFTMPFEMNNAWVRGAHTIRFGVQYSFEGKDEVASATFNETNGVFTFDGSKSGDSIADLLLGRAFRYEEVAKNPFGLYRWFNLQGYAQDEFRVRPNLTLTLGLRYNFYKPEYEINNLLSGFNPSTFDPLKAATVNPDGTVVPGTENFLNGLFQPPGPFGRPIINSQKKGFAPRVSVVWDPTSSGKMAVRAGYGIFYDRWGSFSQFSSSNPPVNDTVTIFNTLLSNPGGGVGATRPIFPLSLRSPITPWRLPTIQKWSVGIQHELPARVIAEVSYVGTKGTHLNGNRDLNQPLPSVDIANGVISPNAVRPFRGFGSITAWATDRDSTYHSLQVSARRQFDRGLAFQVAYTLSKTLTNASNVWGGPQDSRNLRAEKGLADFDSRQVLTFNYLWEIPFFHDKKGYTKAALDGWQIGGITTFQKGFPLTVTLPFDNEGIGGGLERPNLIGNVSRPKTLARWFDTSVFALPPVGTFGNSPNGVVRGPGVTNWDFAVYRQLRIPNPYTENLQAQIRAQFFNIFNHTQPSGVDATFGSSTFGRVTSARDPRIVQFGIELSF